MKITFAGSGSAFTIGEGNYQSNMILENEDSKRLLIDCGSDIRFSLYELGLSAKDIQAVFISHLHADHTGGLEWLAFNTYFCHLKKPLLFISETIAEDLWNRVLSGGLSSLEDKNADLTTYFNVKEVASRNVFTWAGIKFTLVPTLHTESGKKINPSYGLFFKVNGKNVLVTADTQFTPETLGEYYQKADIIFHDCETNPIPSGVHAHFKQLNQLESSLKKKMWLYHYNTGKRPDAKKNGFLGFAQKGQAIDFSRI